MGIGSLTQSENMLDYTKQWH